MSATDTPDAAGDPTAAGPTGDAGHAGAAREGDHPLDQVLSARDQLRARARERLGVTGDGKDLPPLRQVLRQPGVSPYPLLALGILIVVDQFHSYAFAVLAPDIARTLGFGSSAVAGLLAVRTIAAAVSPLPMAALVQRVPRRALLAVGAAFLWTAATAGNAFVVTLWGLLFVLLLDGLTSGATTALHTPLLMDSYPPEGRVRVLSAYAGFQGIGQVGSPLLVALLAGALGFTWRGVFLVMGVVTLAGALTSIGLRDPGFGRFDTQRIRDEVQRAHDDLVDVAADDVHLRFFEIVRRLLLVPTLRRLLAGYAILGVLLIPYQTFLFFFLEEQWNMGPGARGLFFAWIAAASVVALVLFARRGEMMFRQDPARLVRLGGSTLLAGVVLIAFGSGTQSFALMLALFGVASALLAILQPALGITVMSILPPQMRAHAGALTGIFLGGVGGLAGALFLSGIERRFGVAGAIVSLLVPGVIGALVIRSASKFVVADLDRMIDEVIEQEEVEHLTSAGQRLPLLACRGINFSYGQLQVLFDVDFTVDDGEMVALLGVNGAGKSTLLRVISGLGLPTSGTVRLAGKDITYLDTERRTRLGITQVPGGRAVFGPMTVVENLRLFGYTLGRDREAIDAAIERSFDAFPRLAERRNQTAATLSGGEQQMLGMSRALILKPRLLLIDELSLGLAPIIVEQLLDMVRRINADGTAIVLVEQSVNVALSLVNHAYFMEKGQVRFDGAAADLLDRTDLLRAVFLEGVAGTDDQAGT